MTGANSPKRGSRVPVWADAIEVTIAAKQWSDAVLMCRTIGHAWNPSETNVNRDMGYYHLVLTCLRCGSERHEETSLKGSVFGNWIKYAPGYLTEGIGRIAGESKARLRTELFRRQALIATTDTARTRKAREAHVVPVDLDAAHTS